MQTPALAPLLPIRRRDRFRVTWADHSPVPKSDSLNALAVSIQATHQATATIVALTRRTSATRAPAHLIEKWGTARLQPEAITMTLSI